MTSILIFDTETTGLPKNWRSNAHESPDNWPDLVSIAWNLYNRDGTLLKKEYAIVKPRDWTIPQESTAIHGITHEYAMAHGYELAFVLSKFANDLKKAGLVVAHNMTFDRNVVFNAFAWRLSIDAREFWPLGEFCTMDGTRNILKLPYAKPNAYYYKPPKLDELYRATFGCDAPTNAHNSARDTDVLSQIYWARWPEKLK